MADEIIIETTSAEVIEVGVPGPQGPAGAAGTGLETLTTKGDTLYRGETTGERLPIGSVGQVMKVSSGGVPHWANESGAVTSVNGQTGEVTLTAADVAAAEDNHSHNSSEIEFNGVEISGAGSANANGVFVLNGTLNGRGIYYKSKDDYIYWETDRWFIASGSDDLYASTGNTSALHPWQVGGWSVIAGVGAAPAPSFARINGNQYELVIGQRTNPTLRGDAAGKNVGTGANDVAAGNHTHSAATQSVAGFLSAADKTKLDGIAANATANTASSATPSALGTASSGSSSDYARADHVHPMPSAADVGAAASSHSSSHHTGGTDAIAPNQISAAWALVRSFSSMSGNVSLSAGRARHITYTLLGGSYQVTLPLTGNQAGDICRFTNGPSSSAGAVLTIARGSGSGATVPITTLAIGQTASLFNTDGSETGWRLEGVDTHTHPSTQITGLGTAATQDSTAFAPATGISPTAITGTAVVDSDARLSDSRTPTAHAASHASAGSDPVTPASIGAQSIFETASAATNTGTLTASRAKIWSLLDFTNSSYNLKLPRTGAQVGDIVVIRVASNASWGANSQVTIGYDFEDTPGVPDFISLITISQKGVQYRYQCTTANSFGASYTLIDVDTHTHAASAITSGTLTHERGGLEADVSAYNGLVKISGGATSAVTVTATGESVIGAADAAAARSAISAAAASHTHGTGDITGLAAIATSGSASDLTTGTVGTARLGTGTADNTTFLRGDGSWATPAGGGGGVSAIGASAADILSVSGSDLVADDPNADRIVFWDDSASALKYLEVSTGLSLSGTTLTATATGTIGGSTGATDNLLLRSDGTGAATLQNSALQLDDATTSTQANVAVVNAHSETNSALVLTPKGNGAFIVGPKPDGTATGGNARGTNSIDIQLTRTNANQVASGNSCVVIGTGSRASANETVVIGASATSTAIRSVALGLSATANGGGSVSIGELSSSGGANSVALGRIADANLRGMLSTVPFNAVYWGGQTTDGTANVELNLDATATNRLTIAANTAVLADIYVVARQTDNTRFLAARRWVAIRRDGSNNTALIGSVVDIGTDQSAGSPAWTFTIDADDTASVEALRIRVTGAASQTVNWRVMALYRVVA